MRNLFCEDCGSFDFNEANCCVNCGRYFPASRYPEVHNRRVLLDKDKANIQLGQAPDGLPWIIKGLEGAGPEVWLPKMSCFHRAMHNTMNFRDVDQWPENIRETWEQLSDQLMEYYPRQNIVAWKNFASSGLADYYYSNVAVKRNRFLGITLLASIMKSDRTRLLREDSNVISASNSASMEVSSSHEDSMERMAARREALEARRNEFQIQAEHPLHLAFAMDNDDVVLLNRKYLSSARPYIFESLASLPEIHYSLSLNDAKPKLPYSDRSSYEKHLYKTLCQPGTDIVYSLKRQDLLLVLARFFRQMGKEHQAGRVHGDLKAGNILLTAAGFTSIDSLNMEPGQQSYAATTFWAAPEQILGGCVSPASDVYSLVRLLTELLKGLIYGEEANYIIPTANRKLHTVTMIKDPYIHLEAENPEQVGKWQLAWENFLRKGLAFDPGSRFTDAAMLADELEALLEVYPVPGEIAFRPHWGKLALVKMDQELYTLAWII